MSLVVLGILTLIFFHLHLVAQRLLRGRLSHLHRPTIKKVQSLNNATATWAGYYRAWTISWQFVGMAATCKAKGDDYVGGVGVVVSTAWASAEAHFTPNL